MYTNRDYSQHEIDHILNELLEIQRSRFNDTEIIYLETLQKMGKISNEDRDHIIAIYDRVRDN